MNKVQKIESEIGQLTQKELQTFRNWFSQFDAEAWDREFAEDVASGNLDSLATEAINDLRSGRCRDL